MKPNSHITKNLTIYVIILCLLIIFIPIAFLFSKKYIPLKELSKKEPPEKLPQYEIIIQTPQFELREIEDSLIPFQNNIPFSTFEQKEKHLYINLAGVWKKERFDCDHRLTLLKRTPEIIKRLEEEAQSHFETKYDDTKWQDKEIPAVENPPPDRYQGCAWYRRQFNVATEHKGKFVKLVFEGANYFSDVWINDSWVGAHEGGYTPFSFDITDYLNYGATNTLAVRVDNIPWLPHRSIYPEDEKLNDRNIIPYKTCDWWNSGGVTRDIYIEVIPNINVVRADVRTKILDEQKAQLLIDIVLYNHSRQKEDLNMELNVFHTKINESNILSMNSKDITDFNRKLTGTNRQEKVTLSPNETKSIHFTLLVDNITLWCPDNSYLYTAAVTLTKDDKAIDEFYAQFGVREVKVDNQKCLLLLNNEPIFLRGLARHEVFAGATGGEDYRGIEGIYRDLLMMKELNANFLRTAHYPNHPATYILADRVGMLIWEEIPLFWFDGPEFDLQRTERKIAKQMWLEMIYRDYNRPSIIFWSTCNECTREDKKERIDYIKDMYDTAYLIDGTRLVVQSAIGDDPEDIAHRVCDLAGITSYYGVFYGKDYYDDTYAALDKYHILLPDKPILLTEFGIWSEKDLSNAWNQVEVAQETFEACRGKPYVCGTTWWCAFDWHTMISEPQSMGLITWDRKALKPAYFALQRIYAKFIGGLNVTLSCPEYDKRLKGDVDFSYTIRDDTDLKEISVILDDKILKIPPKDKKEDTITIDTTSLNEGKHTLLVKAKQDNGLTVSNYCDFFVDNIDEFPIISLNIKDGDDVFEKQIIIAKVEDDRGIEEVLFKSDNQEYSQMKYMGFNNYIAAFDASEYPDGSCALIQIKAIDSGDNETKSSINLNIDKTPAIAVALPFNNDWISYETNPRDADDFYNYPAEFLPESNSWFIHNGKEKVKFKFGSKEDEENNNMECKGQVVPVPLDKYKKVYILGVMHNGNEMHYLTLNYKGKASVKKPMPLSDWWMGNANFGEEVVFLCPYHHEVGEKKEPRVGLYLITLDCDPDKILEAIGFPVNPKVHIFAVTLEK